MARRTKPTPPPFPSKAEIAEFIRDSDTPVGKREIARAFNIKGAQRSELRAVMKQLEDDGVIDRGHKRKVAPRGSLPEVAVLQIDKLDRDGELWAIPTGRVRGEGDQPRILVLGQARSGPAPKLGERVLAKLSRVSADRYDARIIRVLKASVSKILGLLEKDGDGFSLVPTDKKMDRIWQVAKEDLKGGKPGDIVMAEALPGGRFEARKARVVEIVGAVHEPKAFSLIAIHSNDIPSEFPEEVLAEANKAKPVDLGKREDLRAIPLVTIDGADARDFDDAVFAEPDDDPDNEGGWRLVVAIADVSHYVRADAPLDKEAYARGNSVYFPDRVVPMLPQALSNDLCSLRPEEDRACLATHMRIDRNGTLLSERFCRGLMRSRARLTYTQVQRAMDGTPDDVTGDLLEPVIRPLYGAFRSLLFDREQRGTLDLDLPELQVVMGEDGKVAAIHPRDRLDSHRLIEEFMVTANVAAARALEAKHAPAMYRVHDTPPLDKLEGLRESLNAMGFKLAASGEIRPHHFNGILRKAKGTEKAQIVSDLVLRSQAQAVYSPENLGHFGLALQRYCHFTSPIRRYADLLVHRALISAYGLGGGGLPDDQAARFTEIGEHISNTERRAIVAEREATDRYLAAFMQEHVGAEFAGRITGVKKFGLFVRLSETGADGLVPVSTLPWDRYWLDEVHMRLVGERTRLAFQLGEQVTVRLDEVAPITGGLKLEIVEGGSKIKSKRPGGKGAKRGPNSSGRKGGSARAKSTKSKSKKTKDKGKPSRR